MVELDVQDVACVVTILRAASSTVIRNGWSKHFPGFRRAPSNPSPQVSESQVGRKLLELPLPIMPYVGKEERNETCQLEYMCHRSWTPGHVYGVHNGKGAQVIISLDSLKRTIESYDLNWRDERGWGRLTGNVLDRGACLEDRHHIPEIYLRYTNHGSRVFVWFLDVALSLKNLG